jgi:hypothetical protein
VIGGPSRDAAERNLAAGLLDDPTLARLHAVVLVDPSRS